MCDLFLVSGVTCSTQSLDLCGYDSVCVWGGGGGGGGGSSVICSSNSFKIIGIKIVLSYVLRSHSRHGLGVRHWNTDHCGLGSHPAYIWGMIVIIHHWPNLA